MALIPRCFFHVLCMPAGPVGMSPHARLSAVPPAIETRHSRLQSYSRCRSSALSGPVFGRTYMSPQHGMCISWMAGASHSQRLLRDPRGTDLLDQLNDEDSDLFINSNGYICSHPSSFRYMHHAYAYSLHEIIVQLSRAVKYDTRGSSLCNNANTVRSTLACAVRPKYSK